MTPEEIRKQSLADFDSDMMLREIAAQLAELNEKFADFFATQQVEETRK